MGPPLSTPRLTPQKLDSNYGTKIGPVGAAASTTFYVGGVICLNPSGYVTTGSTGASLICLGVLGNQAALLPSGSIASASSNGGTVLEIDQGTFFLDNDPTDPVTLGDLGHACMLSDDHTVSHRATGEVGCIAGTVVGLNPTGTSEPIGVGVWVKLGDLPARGPTGTYL
jgi:hypothetical protein